MNNSGGSAPTPREPIDRLLDAVGAQSSPETVGSHPDDGVLRDYGAGVLSDQAVHKVDQHLETCRDCRDLLIAQRARPELATWAAGTLVWRSRRRRAVGIATAVMAVAAGLLLYIGTGPPPLVPAYEIVGPLGGLETMRGDAPTPTTALTRPVFTPESRMKIILRPADPWDGTAPAVGVFASAADGPLRALAGVVVAEGRDGAFRVTGEARALFGERAGPWTVHVVLAADSEALGRLEGRSPGEARSAAPSVRWFALPLTYQIARQPMPGGP